MTTDVDKPAPETSWDEAPDLLTGALSLELTAEHCNLDYWFREVAGTMLAGTSNGHRPAAQVPEHMRRPGPLREALVEELAFRSIAEEKATRALGDLVSFAPDLTTMDFYATQLIDEARHCRVFRRHLLELGVAEEELADTVERVAGADRDRVLVPLEQFADQVRRDRDFAGGVVILTILVEGILAPTAELSERKWRPLNPAAADIERGAGMDEIRHLTVGSDIVRRHLIERPEEKARIAEIVERGRRLWDELPVLGVLERRENLYQQGLEQHRDLVGDYEIRPGRRLIDTTPLERIELAATWAAEMQDSRLKYMGLEDV
jgi:hypothetical protein